MACARPSLLAPKDVGFLFAVVLMFDSVHGESSTQLTEPTFARVVYASDNCAISGFLSTPRAICKPYISGKASPV
jgi:hypothetical protein